MFKKNENKSEDISSILSNKDKLNAAKQNNIEIKERKKLKNKKLYIIVAIIAIIIVIMATLITSYLNNKMYKLYIKYEEKMQIYGFDKMYNNKTAKTSESVTKAEALKLVLSAVFNTYDISGFAAEHNEYENAIWVEYAKDSEITKEDINVSSYKHKAKYIDVITYFENCKIKFLKQQPIKSTDVIIKDINKYTTDQQIAIKDMVGNEVINLFSNNVKGNKYIFKGELNELVINFVEKYNIIAPLGEKLNINPEKIPANAAEYPYTLATIDKSIYEKPFFLGYDIKKMSPKELYTYKKDYYPQIEMVSEGFFNEILNIDYKTITEESLKSKLEQYLVFRADDFAIASYVKHVKDNEIVIEGDSQLQFPIIYFDGESYRARLRLKFEVKHSKTKDSLLYLDMLDSLKERYENKSYDILVDYYLANAFGNNNMYVDEKKLYDTILDNDKCGITKEVDSVITTTENDTNRD
jgi:hypothetical protein